MERAAGKDGVEGLRQRAGGLPARPPAGAALARVHLEYQGAHRAPETGGPRWAVDPAILRRVRDVLASGVRP
jgi:hypothetical protein